MALKDFQTTESAARSRRGTTGRSLGATTVAPTQSKSQAPNFTGWASNFAKQLGSMASSGLFKLGEYTVNTPKYVYEGVKPGLNAVARTITGNLNADVGQLESQRVQLDDQFDKMTAEYKAGRMSKDNFSKALKAYGESNQQLNKSSVELEENLNRETRDAMIGLATTAATVLLGGRLQLKSTPAAALRRTATASSTQASKNAVVQSIVNQSATKLEKAVTQIPAVRDLVVRNMQYLGRREAQQMIGESTAQYLARESKALAVNMLFKRPILYEMNIQGAQDVYDKIIEGDYDDAAKQAAWMSTQLLSGGPLGAAASGFKWLGGKNRELTYGSGSFIDEISKQIGNKNANQVAEYLTDLKSTNPAAFKEAERVLRIVQEANLQMTGDDALQAANRVLQHWDEYAINLGTVTPEKVVALLKNWAEAHQLKNAMIQAGKLPGVKPSEAGKYVVVRWDTEARDALSRTLEEAGGDWQKTADNYTAWLLAPGNAAAQNPILTGKVEDIINRTLATDGGGVAQLVKEIKDISAASLMTKNIPKAYQKKLSELGFAIAQPSRLARLDDELGRAKITPAVNYEDTRRLITAAQDGDKEIFDIATAPQPQLNYFSKLVEGAGVSPRESNIAANRVLSQQIVSDLDEIALRSLGISQKPDADTMAAGQAMLSKLQRYVEDKQPSRIGNVFVGGRAVAPAITDIRQLTNKEVMEALGVGSSEAKEISRAIINAYAKVPMEYRGLGDKVVDNLFKFNPAQKYYSRIQSALRYTYNPFFRAQESFETAALSRAQARTILWNRSTQELNDASRILDDSGIFRNGLSGEAAQDLVIGRITANITPGQKRNLAGLALTIAKQRNMDLQTLIQRHPEDINDALRVVVQYPNKGVLNSSLARTLNIAFFPIRYNAKVTALAAQVLSKEAPSVQLAVINSLFNLRDWLKSDEGIKWQSANAEALAVFNWLTPVGSIKYGLERLTRQPDSIGEMGALGGLPLGFITQMLDSQGLININTPYVQPKTGDVLPRYIPETTKARAATAMGDLLNSMFTYPGRILGLPGKNQAINTAVRQFIDTNGSDFEKRIDTERLTPLQQRWINVLKGDTSPEAVDALYNAAADGQFNWYTLPPLELPVRTPVEDVAPVKQRTGLPRKASRKGGAKEKNYALPITRP